MKTLNNISSIRWIKHQYNSQMFWIRLGVIGIWGIVFLLLGSIFGEEDAAIDVHVRGGWIDGIDNTVDVSGSAVDVSGSVVDVNEVNDIVTVHGTVSTW